MKTSTSAIIIIIVLIVAIAAGYLVTQPEPEPTPTPGEATFSISPTSGRIGTTVTLTGAEFEPNADVLIRFGDTVAKTATASEDGELQVSFSVPITAAGEFQITTGPESITRTFEVVRLKVAMAVSTSIHDVGWCDIGYSASEYLVDKYDVEMAYHEFTAFPDMERVLKDYAAKGYDLVIGHGGGFEQASLAAAEAYPDTYFLCTAGRYEAPNLVSYIHKWRELAYIAGVEAALLTQTNKVGVIQAAKYPVIVDLTNGFKLGARSVNPEIEVFTVYVGSWGDPGSGKDYAETMIANGADFLFSWAGPTGVGAITATLESGIYFFPESQDHYGLASTVSPAYCWYSMEPIFDETVKAILEDKFEGVNYSPGVKEGWLEIRTTALMPEDVRETIEETFDKIVSGEIVVPENYED